MEFTGKKLAEFVESWFSEVEFNRETHEHWMEEEEKEAKKEICYILRNLDK